ncbi:hypothetical protein A2U01_0112337, partial [Trifolium medium]|nr:hypothetical protein [Trifolium medium]
MNLQGREKASILFDMNSQGWEKAASIPFDMNSQDQEK